MLYLLLVLFNRYFVCCNGFSYIYSFTQQFSEHLRRHRYPMADQYSIQLLCVPWTALHPEFGRPQLLSFSILRHVSRLHRSSRASAIDPRGRARRAESVGLGDVGLFHDSLDCFRRSLLAKGFGPNLKQRHIATELCLLKIVVHSFLAFERSTS